MKASRGFFAVRWFVLEIRSRGLMFPNTPDYFFHLDLEITSYYLHIEPSEIVKLKLR